MNFLDNVTELQKELREKTYTHGAYHAFKINDPKPRDIHKALVRDRLLHHALYRILYPYFDQLFIHDSYSCRIDKGTHRAMDRFRLFAQRVSRNDTRACWVLKCDIRKFFATIDHAVLKKILARHIVDADILWCLGRVIDSFHTEKKTGKGLPLGNLASQLLVNIYMNTFDHWMKREQKARYYIRYADDFLVLSTDRGWLVRLEREIGRYLKEHLALELHPDKVSIRTSSSGVDFLGWVHFPHHRVLRTTTKWRMLRRVAERSDNEATLQSYRGLLSHGNAYNLRQMLPEGESGRMLA